ncbi:MAG: DUF4340 domain-containing protein [Proteobacteria bacterium]|nr:DUF4340 domain-containing protein [Desulfobacula sp.]MBU4133121.1 DUF4340 domain-containing protein [Pseudomonadota bacterium]
MKKEYILLAVLILALSAYLVFKKDNQRNYTLPQPVSIEKGKIDRMVISQKKAPDGLTIELKKDKDAWAVTDKNFTADMTAVNNMLDVARDLRLSALISESADLIRYELDEARAVGVIVASGKETLLEFKIGKTAPSGNHTFVMLAGDTRIYQADGSFRNAFDTTVDALRDKRVLTFKEEAINRITLEKGGVSKVLSAVQTPDGKEKPSVSWRFEDKTLPDGEALTNLLSSLSFLACESFSDKFSKQDLEKNPPTCKITLENETPIVLNLFDRDNGETLFGTSSASPYAFILESYKGKDILSYVDKIAGLAEETKK